MGTSSVCVTRLITWGFVAVCGRASAGYSNSPWTRNYTHVCRTSGWYVRTYVRTYDRHLRPASNTCRNKRASRNTQSGRARCVPPSIARARPIAIDLRLRQYNRQVSDIAGRVKHTEVVARSVLWRIYCVHAKRSCYWTRAYVWISARREIQFAVINPL